jgi:hypothetical protein
MSIIYTINSFASSTMKYDDPVGSSNYCVLDTLNRVRGAREFCAKYDWKKCKAEFELRQRIYEELLSHKHGELLEIALLETEKYVWIRSQAEREYYLIRYADGFSVIKEVDYRPSGNEYVDESITYYIGHDMSDTNDLHKSIGHITKYGKRV